MGFLFHDDGESWGLQCLFSAQQTVSTTYALGLCSDTLVEADRIADILNEPTGGGYSRQLVVGSVQDFTITKTDPSWTAAMDAVAWTASGANIGTVDRWFFTNEAVSGSLGGSAFLLASGDIDPERTVNDGDTLNLTAYLTLK